MIEVVGMIYKSVGFFEFMKSQGCVNRIVGNDPTGDVEPYLYDVYHDQDENDNYLARVYRCWNYCVESSKADYVCLVNSDMAFAPGWLEALERRLDGRTLPTSRLVEPGYLRPGQHALEIDLGRDPRQFPHDAWAAMAADLSEDRVVPGGLFMPCVVNRDAFLAVGGYPHGNVGGISGDKILFDKLGHVGYQHVTCFDSLVYHMQEGEMSYKE